MSSVIVQKPRRTINIPLNSYRVIGSPAEDGERRGGGGSGEGRGRERMEEKRGGDWQRYRLSTSMLIALSSVGISFSVHFLQIRCQIRCMPKTWF